MAGVRVRVRFFLFFFCVCCLYQVANDDLCLNLHAAYDLTTAEYDEVRVLCP